MKSYETKVNGSRWISFLLSVFPIGFVLGRLRECAPSLPLAIYRLCVSYDNGRYKPEIDIYEILPQQRQEQAKVLGSSWKHSSPPPPPRPY